MDRYSCILKPASHPMPDCFTPPNGAAAFDTPPMLDQASRFQRLDQALARASLCVRVADQACSVSLAIRTLPPHRRRDVLSTGENLLAEDVAAGAPVTTVVGKTFRADQRDARR